MARDFRKSHRPGEPPKGQKYAVKESSALLPYLIGTLRQQSKTSIKGLLRRGQIWVNGVPTTHFDTPLNEGDEVFVSCEKGRVEFNHPQLNIVWEDDDIIVVDKKEGLLSVSDSPAQERTAYFLLSQYVKKKGPRNKIFVLHRLDKGTSGLMMFAKNLKTQYKLRSNWHDMVTRRTYVAVVEGRPAPPSGTITSYLSENSRMKVYCTDAAHGKEATLRYNVLKSGKAYSLVEFELETGRKNQIRAQMEHFGNPIAGDPKYGAKTDPAGRLMLHAFRLFFIHPATGREMRFETPTPRTFDSLF